MSFFPEKLFVYECRGPASPGMEPAGEGYLGIWPEAPFYYLFFDRPARARICNWLEENGDKWSLTGSYQLDYRQWQQVSIQSHHVGPFFIQPRSAPDFPTDSGEDIPILLNPGVVFGTGLHETTRGCLLTIADLFKHHAIASVLDLGTGTGILALACAALGATRVMAVDCNPLAVRITRDNVLSNHRGAVIGVVAARDLEVFREGSDLLLMNLEYPCLRQVLGQKAWLRYRWVVMSGFLHSQWPEIADLVTDSSTLLLQRDLDGWMTVAVQSKLFEA